MRTSYSGLAERRCPSGEPAIGFWLGCPPAGKPFLDSFSNVGKIKTMRRILGRARATEPAVRVPWIRSNRRSGAADCRPHGSHDGHQVPQAPAPTQSSRSTTSQIADPRTRARTPPPEPSWQTSQLPPPGYSNAERHIALYTVSLYSMELNSLAPGRATLYPAEPRRSVLNALNCIPSSRPSHRRACSKHRPRPLHAKSPFHHGNSHRRKRPRHTD